MNNEQVAQALDGKCRVLKMDSDDESEMASTLNVSSFFAETGFCDHRARAVICSVLLIASQGTQAGWW